MRARAFRACAHDAICVMRCLNPIDAWYVRGKRTKNGRRVLSFRPPAKLSILNLGSDGMLKPDLQLPCGRCFLCLDNKRRQWVNRLIAETFDNVASFLTLTIDDRYYDDIFYDDKGAIQRFIKRFRISCQRSGKFLPKFKYFVVNEYGHNTSRLHFHAIFFGVDLLRDPFFDSYCATSKRDSHGRVFPIFSSRFISSLWRYGFNAVDRCTDRSVRYVAKYVSKSARDKYLWALYSQRIGTSLFIDSNRCLTPFGRSVFSSGKLLLSRDGFPSRPPKFLDRYAQLTDDKLYKSVKQSRQSYVRLAKTDYDCIRGHAIAISHQIDLAKRNEIL